MFRQVVALFLIRSTVTVAITISSLIAVAAPKILTKNLLDTTSSKQLGVQISEGVGTRFGFANDYEALRLGKDVYRANPEVARVGIRTDPDILEIILSGGKILNQHQTKSSGGGGYNPSQRMRIEERISGYKFETTVRKDPKLLELLPKYGLVEFPDFVTDPEVRKNTELPSPQDNIEGYGSVMIYLKDAVKSRTTFFPEDTGNHLDLQHGQSLGQKEILLIWEHMQMGEYFEAQIWGPLSVSDIDFIAMDKSDLDGNPKLRGLLKKRGLMVRAIKSWRELSQEDLVTQNLRVTPLDKVILKAPAKASISRCAELFKNISK